jgi:class 3 adenylate cyclase
MITAQQRLLLRGAPMQNRPASIVQRRLAAIFFADVAGYARLMNTDEAATLRLLASHREITDRLILHHGGRIANTAGDSILHVRNVASGSRSYTRSSSSNSLAAFRSGVSKPSVNQPQMGAKNSWALCLSPCSAHSRARS